MKLTIESNGTRKVKDGPITYTYFGHQIINVECEPEHCKHQLSVKTYSGPDGSMHHCHLCQSTIDENGEIIKTDKKIPF